ncbi:hypothetical protein WA171_002183 [Blastocystis sp. BT1]
METKGKEDITSSMKPYMDEYATVSSNLIPRMNTLDKEFTSLIEDMESLAKQAHTEELSKLVKCLSQTRANLGQIGELLKDVETRIDEVEKKVGLDDDDL